MKILLKNKLQLHWALLLLPIAATIPGFAQTQKPAYLQGMQAVIAGGTTPETVTPAKIDGLKQLGTRRLRLINVEHTTLTAIAPDGTPTMQWPVTLTYPLKLCRQNHWVPHIIVGHVVPPPLAKVGRNGRKYGPTSWTDYDKYIDAFLKYVVVDQGFTETEWEVGNEMNAASQNWVASELPAASTDEMGFNAYATLYSHIAKDVDNFRRQHPGTTLRVGGPAEAEDGHLPPQVDWVTRFVRYVAANHVPADFVSFHAYGNATTGATIESLIGAIRAALTSGDSSANVAITEWGPSYESTPGLNYDPIAGAFALDYAAKMAQFGIHDTMFLSLSQIPAESGWPAFYKIDGSPSHIMLALLAVANLKGKPAPCVGAAGISCVAATNVDGTVDVVFWNYNWMTDKFPRVMPSRKATVSTFTVSQIENQGAGTYDLSTATMNSAPWQGNKSPENFARMSPAGLTFSFSVPYGNYGEFVLKPHGAGAH